MKKLVIIGVLGALGFLIYNQFFRYEFYEGTWISNREMTVRSMNRIKTIPKKTRLAMAPLFGKMVVHVEGGYLEYYFKDDPDNVTKQPIKFEVLAPDRVKYTTYEPVLGRTQTRELLFTNGCYSVEVTKWKFKEFFCRKTLF